MARVRVVGLVGARAMRGCCSYVYLSALPSRVVARRFTRGRATLASAQHPVTLPVPSGSEPCIGSQFRERFFAVDNVRSLYRIQKRLLSPCVDERKSTRDGKKCVEITWQMGGASLRGVGTAAKKKHAWCLAASQLLRGVHLSEKALDQMRKQMVDSLRLLLNAKPLRDAAVPSAVPGEYAHEVVWQGTQDGSLPLALSATGFGETPVDAQHTAMENMFLKASEAASAVKEDASHLTPAAISEIRVRHDTVINGRHIEVRYDTKAYSSGFLCTLQWRWPDGGEQRVETTSGFGRSILVAKGAAMHTMLVAQGFAADLTPEVLTRGAVIRSLVETRRDSALTAAMTFLETQPVAAWSNTRLHVWKWVLTLGDVGRITELGNAMRQALPAPESSFEGVAPDIWEEMLDSCAMVANGPTARAGVAALERVPLMTETFCSALHRDYFRHFRRLVAWELVAETQTALDQFADGDLGVSVWKEKCKLFNLTVSAENEAAFLAAALRPHDIVVVRPVGMGGAVLATVTSTKPESLKCTFSCELGDVACLEATEFRVRLLVSAVSSRRMTLALRQFTQHQQDGTTDLGTLLVESFSEQNRSIVEVASRDRPPGQRDPENEVRLLDMVLRRAADRGVVLNESQLRAVSSAIEQQLTLIHGPPGTGKTTTAVQIVSAWRHSGEKILLAADSNVAADNLHSSLKRFGIEALRFSMFQEDLDDVSVRRVDTLAGTGTSRQRVSESGHRKMIKGVSDFQIVVTTCCSAGHPALEGVSFPSVLIDECTQSVEPMSLVPLTHGCRRAVLIGDHRQLPPTVLGCEARRGGLERSLFARLVEKDRGLAGGFDVAAAEPVLLDEQWRMHPSIAAFPNFTFYEGRLKNAAPERSVISAVPWPMSGEHRVLLVDVGGVESRDGTSYANDVEVSAVLDLIKHVTDCRAVQPEEIAIITPYQGQKDLFQRAFGRRAGNADLLGRVRLATVDGFQGAEVDLVVFSAVRSNVWGKLGFVKDLRRANVLLTRARRGLIIFADASTMRQASRSVWASWLRMQEARRAVVRLADFQQRF